MKRLPSHHSASSQSGFALPLVLIFLLVFSVMGLSLVARFSGSGAKETVQFQSTNKKYGPALAGIERAKYEMLRPDNPGSAHLWGTAFANNNGVPTNNFTMNIDGDNVTVTVQDIDWGN